MKNYVSYKELNGKEFEINAIYEAEGKYGKYVTFYVSGDSDNIYTTSWMGLLKFKKLPVKATVVPVVKEDKVYYNFKFIK